MEGLRTAGLLVGVVALHTGKEGKESSGAIAQLSRAQGASFEFWSFCLPGLATKLVFLGLDPSSPGGVDSGRTPMLPKKQELSGCPTQRRHWPWVQLCKRKSTETILFSPVSLIQMLGMINRFVFLRAWCCGLIIPSSGVFILPMLTAWVI